MASVSQSVTTGFVTVCEVTYEALISQSRQGVCEVIYVASVSQLSHVRLCYEGV